MAVYPALFLRKMLFSCSDVLNVVWSNDQLIIASAFWEKEEIKSYEQTELSNFPFFKT